MTCVTCKANQVEISDPDSPKAKPNKFSYDFVFDSSTPGSANFITQDLVFDRLGLGILSRAWQGYNAAIFAYGQTGSGKTHSIMGGASIPSSNPLSTHPLVAT